MSRRQLGPLENLANATQNREPDIAIKIVERYPHTSSGFHLKQMTRFLSLKQIIPEWSNDDIWKLMLSFPHYDSVETFIPIISDCVEIGTTFPKISKDEIFDMVTDMRINVPRLVEKSGLTAKTVESVMYTRKRYFHEFEACYNSLFTIKFQYLMENGMDEETASLRAGTKRSVKDILESVSLIAPEPRP